MSEKLEKAVCLVNVGNLVSRELMDITTSGRADEVDFCERSGVPYFVIPIVPYTNQTRENTKVKQLKKFGNLPNLVAAPVKSLKGYDILLRSWVQQTPFALDAIEDLGGRNVITRDMFDVVNNWPSHVLPEYVNREIGMGTFSQLSSRLDDYAIDGKVFVKTREKIRDGWGILTSVERVLAAGPDALPYLNKSSREESTLALSPDTELIVSQPLEMLAGSDGRTEEYRMWVFNGEVVAATRYGLPDDTNIPSDVVAFAGDFVKAHTDKLPRHYVLDAGRTNGNGVVAVELNDIACSGNTNDGVFGAILTSYFGKDICGK